MVVKPINDNENQAPECVTTPSPNIKTTTTLIVATIIISLLLISQQQNQQNCNQNNNNSVDLDTVIINRHLTLDGINSDEALTTTIIKTALKSNNQNPQLNTDKIGCYIDKNKKQIIIFTTDTNVYHNIVIINYDVTNNFNIISNIDTILTTFAIDKSGTMYAGGYSNSYNNNGFYIKKRDDKTFQKFTNLGIKGAIRALQVDHDGNLWVGTHSGNFTGFLYKKDFNSEQFRAIFTNHEVRTLTVDGQNNLYFCYWRSNARFIMQKAFNSSNFIPGKQEPSWPITLVADNDNNVYLGGKYINRAIIMKKLFGVGNTFRELDSKSIKGENVIALAADNKGTVYGISQVGANQSKIYQKNNSDKKFWEICTMQGKSEAIAVNDKGTVFIGVQNKLYQKNTGDKDFQEIGSVIGYIIKLAIIDNVLWVGTRVSTNQANYSSLIYKQEIKIVTK